MLDEASERNPVAVKKEFKVFLTRHHEHRILGCMLFLLQSAMWWDFGGASSRSLMLAHLGLFLIWQPFWSRDERLGWHRALIFVAATLAFVVWLNWWFLVFWLLLLTGLVGGRVAVKRRDRYAHLAALLFLVSALLIGCVPQMFSVHSLATEVHVLVGYGLLAVPAVLVFVSASETGPLQAQGVDFLYGLMIAMLASILAMGSLLSMYYTGAAYPVAVLQTILGIALFLFAISWLWMPLAGFSGLGQLWERYLLNVGTPFEEWLGRLARLGLGEATGEQYLRAAMDQLIELPWVAGVTWETARGTGELGKPTPYAFRIQTGDINGVVYAHRPMGAGLVLHGNLLMQLVAHFYRAKERERELTKHAHLRAVHETGARVTHDIKNLLQSLHTMTLALQHSTGERQAEAQNLLRRQLPRLTERLQLALEKLQTPREESAESGHLSEWWKELQARNAGRGISFQAELGTDPVVPVDLFDSVAENLLENARTKRQLDPHVVITVKLVAEHDGTRLSVCDSGDGIPGDLARELFKGPVESRNGLGIGLYQAARQAEKLGYELSLKSGASGRVCFQLARTPQESRTES